MLRRSFLVGLGSMLAAPAIVHAGNLMPIRTPKMSDPILVLHPDLGFCLYDPNEDSDEFPGMGSPEYLARLAAQCTTQVTAYS